MATLREYILSQSTLPTGSTVRDHIQNPITGGGGDPYPVYYKDVEVSAEVKTISIGVNTPRVEVETQDISISTEDGAEIDVPTIKVEVD